MNCYNHTETISVAQCQDCQKGLCSICAKNYSIPICIECNSQRGNIEKQDIIKELFITFGFGIIVTYFFINSKNFQNYPINMNIILVWIFSIYTFSSFVAGWKTLSKLTSNYFIFLPIIGWVIYFVIKLSISSMIGYFMLPIRTYNNISKLKKINSIKKFV